MGYHKSGDCSTEECCKSKELNAISAVVKMVAPCKYSAKMFLRLEHVCGEVMPGYAIEIDLLQKSILIKIFPLTRGRA